ncbi:ribosome silencing factor [Kribbella qitaiheensis]|uniref:Ribosomal silencing factor RsfS n=1 Tax=Kribbella qitaiheensis TaxID=1544730 RepID=A0A7G6X5W8_9ACTN|nr:ribosome silencing factor [Kribbella qitaiheensis]
MPATERVVELLKAAAEAAHDKKAENVLAFDVSEQLAITDAFLVASASNDRQVRAIVDAIEEKLRVDFDAKPVRREGAREGRWVLLDYLEVVIHVQHDEERNFYSLERLWRDCPLIPIPGPDGKIPEPAPVQPRSGEEDVPALGSDEASVADDAAAAEAGSLEADAQVAAPSAPAE